MVNKPVLISDEIANISDSQLQKRLKDEFNFSCGPITSTTKGIYIKKLQEFINGNVTASKPTPAKQVAPTTPKTRRKTLATPVIDVEIKKTESPKSTRRASVGRSTLRSKATNKEEVINSISNFSDTETEDLIVNEIKPSTSINGQTALEYSRGSRLLKRTFNNRVSSPIAASTRSATNASLISSRQKETITGNDSFSSDDSVKKAGGIESGYSVNKNQISSRAFRLFNRSSSLSNYSDSENENEEASNLKNKKEASLFTENITKRLLRHRPKTVNTNNLTTTKTILNNKDYSSSKYLNNQQIVSQANQNEVTQSDSYITQSNWISYSILMAVSLFFVFIFSFYFYSRYFSTIGLNVEETELNALEKELDLNIHDLNIPGCLEINETSGICSKKQIRPILLIIKEMKNIVDKKLTNYYCSSVQNTVENPYEYSTKSLKNQIEMSIGTSVVELARQFRSDKTKPAEPADLFLSLFANALDLLNNNSKWYMKPVGDNGKFEKIVIDPNYPKPLHTTCQVKLFVIRTFWWFVILVAVSSAGFLVYLYIKRLKNEAEKEKRLLFELVHKSIELLQSPDEPQSLPILHIRDMLLDPSQRKLPYYQKIWDRVVQFIEDNESRIKSSLENIDGEDYKTWKWVATNKTQPDSTVIKPMTSNNQINEWQGNVFSEDNSPIIDSQTISTEKSSRTINTSTPIKNNSTNIISSSQLKDFVALTRFLKVRNVVDRQNAELDENLKLDLRNAIIQRCSKHSKDGKTHGIQHLYVDDRNDGLVYIKCDSIETASNAFKALNGTICDLNLDLVIGSCAGLVILSFLGLAIYIVLQRRNFSKVKQKYFQQHGGWILLEKIKSKQAFSFTIFTEQQLEQATNNFDSANIIGHGGQGTVYKGILRDQIVAIKKCKIVDESKKKEFGKEILILSQINHKNIVKLLGCCLEVDVPMLVYEFIPNGTLFHYIHHKKPGSHIPLITRLRVAHESAEALAYLHTSASPPIFHGDVKSANILLDQNYTARVSDFGASMQAPKDKVQFVTLVQGTCGYLDPEYMQSCQLTDKSDVYSFGVILVELLTSKPVIDFDAPEEERSLSSRFLLAIKENKLHELLDDEIKHEDDMKLIIEVVGLAKECLSIKGEERPLMKEVAEELQRISKLKQHPWGQEYNTEETRSLLSEESHHNIEIEHSGYYFNVDKEAEQSIAVGR